MEYIKINLSLVFSEITTASLHSHATVHKPGMWFKPNSTEKPISYALTAVSIILMKKTLLIKFSAGLKPQVFRYKLVTSQSFQTTAKTMGSFPLYNLIYYWHEKHNADKKYSSSLCRTLVSKIVCHKTRTPVLQGLQEHVLQNFFLRWTDDYVNTIS